MTNRTKYIVHDFMYYPTKTAINKTKMLKLAKDYLRANHNIGIDKAVRLSDLDNSINAWVYLVNIGVGHDTIQTN